MISPEEREQGAGISPNYAAYVEGLEEGRDRLLDLLKRLQLSERAI